LNRALLFVFGIFALPGGSAFASKVIAPGQTISVQGEEVACVAEDPSIKIDANGNRWKLLLGAQVSLQTAWDLCTALGPGWTVPSAEAVSNTNVRFNATYWLADSQELYQPNAGAYPPWSLWGYRHLYVKDGSKPEIAAVEYAYATRFEDRPRFRVVCAL
jgi:hypothetical protein